METEAEGRKNAAIFQANAEKVAAIARAEADAEKARLVGVGEKSRRTALAEAEAIEGAKRGEAEKSRRVAEADAVRAEGEAKAAAILATGQAEAEAMNRKADAYARYNEAAVIEMLVSALPSITEQVAAPLGSIEKLTVISTDGAGQVAKQVTNGVVQTVQMLKDTTGIDLTKLADKYVSDDNHQQSGTSSGQPSALVNPEQS